MDTYIDGDGFSISPYSDDAVGNLPDWLQALDRPGRDNLLNAATIVHDTVEQLQDRYGTRQETEIALGETDDDYIVERLDGATGIADDSAVVLAYAPAVDGWEETLETATAHEYAHTRYIEQARDHGQGDGTYRKWQQLLLEAHGMHLADQETDADPDYRHAVDADQLQHRYDEIRDELAKESAWEDGGMPFFGGGEDWADWTGYSLAWDVGEELLDEYELDDLAALGEEDVLDAVGTVIDD